MMMPLCLSSRPSKWRNLFLSSLLLFGDNGGGGVFVSSLKPKTDYLVRNLESVVPAYGEFDGEMYAGLIPIHSSSPDENERQGEIMFWLFAPHQPSVTDSLVLWLNGGPGCSSFQCGNLFETGPVTVPLRPAGWCCSHHDDPLAVNENSWTKATYLLFVEQPVGVGFSHGPWPETEDDVAEDMVGWLHNFFTIFEELKDYEFHIFGESYAGMYVPAIARGIHHDNLKPAEEREGGASKINLKGIAMGNGWIDVQIQGPVVIEYAYWHGMINQNQRDAFLEEWETCLSSSPYNNNTDEANSITIQEPYHVFTTPDECGIAGVVLKAAGQDVWRGQVEPNTYDVTTWDTYPVIQDGNTTIQNFYNHPDVQKALNAPIGQHWQGCLPGEGRRRRLQHLGRRRRRQRRRYLKEEEVPTVGSLMLDQDRPLSMLDYIAELLDDAKIRVLVYNADLDMSVNAQGSEAALNVMKWSGTERWANQDRGIWTTPTQVDKVAGYAKQVDGLTFLIVRNSGHLVPYNQPQNGLDLLTRHLQHQSFVDELVPFYTADPLPKSRQQQQQSNPETTAPTGTIIGIAVLGPHVILTYIVLLAIGFGMGYCVSRQSRRGGYQPVSNGHPPNGNGAQNNGPSAKVY